jgi:uncharacterized repeat protein (TIGR01451 family)
VVLQSVEEARVSRRSTVGAAAVLAILWGAPALFAANQLMPAPYTLARGDELGSALAVGDGVVAVGAYLSATGGGPESGAVYVFRRDSVPPWSFPARLCGAPGDWFGFDVAIDGTQLLVGAPRARDSSGAQTGAAYMYDLDDPALKAPPPGQHCVPKPQPLSIVAGRAGDEIGSAVALSGTCWAVSARSESNPTGVGAGSVYLYCPPGQPQRPQKLYPQTPADGARFGQSVSLDGCFPTPAGCILAVGAPFAGVGGAAYVFSGPTGGQMTRLPAATVPAGAAFGYAVAVSANQVVVGAPLDNDQGAMAGAAYLYFQSNGTWLPKRLDAKSVAGAQFGVAVAFDHMGHGRIIVGARLEDAGAGVAYLFGSDGLPPPRGSPMLTSPRSESGAEFGFEVAIHDETMVVGAFLQDSGAGAAYLFPPAAPSNVMVTKKTVPGSVAAPGNPLVYSISVTDASGLGIGGLQLTEVVPDQTSFASSRSSPGWSCPATGSGSLCTLPVGNLPPGGTVTRLFAVTIAAPLPAGVTSIANKACARQGPSLALGCDSTSTPTTGAPMLELTKTLQSGSGTPGATLVYQLAVSNTGNQGASPVVVTDQVPQYTTFQPAGSSQTWSCTPGTSAGSTCTAALGTVPAGATVSLALAVKVVNPLPACAATITNTACAGARGTPGAAPACDTVTTPAQGHPHLVLAKHYIGGPALPSAVLTFTLELGNTGDQGACAVTLQETVPAQTTFNAGASTPAWSCAATTPGSACTLAVGGLAAGATSHATFAVTADASLPPATVIHNTAFATTGAGAPVFANAETPPPPPPLHFYTLTPCHALDTRLTGVPLTQFNRRQVYQLSGVCGVPAGAVAVAVKVTLIGATADLSVQGYPGDLAPPGTNTVSVTMQRGTIASFAVLPLAISGTGTLAFLMTIAPPEDEGQTDLLIDVSGYFAP